MRRVGPLNSQTPFFCKAKTVHVCACLVGVQPQPLVFDVPRVTPYEDQSFSGNASALFQGSAPNTAQRYDMHTTQGLADTV